jgi:hypothetical protein
MEDEKLMGVGNEAIGHMERAIVVLKERDVIATKLSLEVIPGGPVPSDEGFYYGVAIPERPRRRLTIEWDE